MTCREMAVLVVALSAGPWVTAVRLPPLPWRRQQAALSQELVSSTVDGEWVGGSPDSAEQHAEAAGAPAAPPTAAERAALLKRRLVLAELEQERLELEVKALRLQLQLRQLKRGEVPELLGAGSAAEARAPSSARAVAQRIRSAATAADPAAARAGQNASGRVSSAEEAFDDRIDSLVASMKLAIADAAGEDRGGGDGDGEQALASGGDPSLLDSYDSTEQDRFREAWKMLGFSEAQLPMTSPITAAETALLQERVFGPDCFSSTEVHPSPIGTFFKGNLRRSAPNASATVQAHLAAIPSLHGRVSLCLINDPMYLIFMAETEDEAWLRLEEASLEEAEEELDLLTDPPLVYLAVPSSVATETSSAANPLALFSWWILTLFTTVAFATGNSNPASLLPPLAAPALTPPSSLPGLASSLATLPAQLTAAAPHAVPVFLSLWALQLAHEAAHCLAAKKHGLRVGLPLPLPSGDLGSFGSHLPLLGFPPNRKAVADFALAGPVVGIGLSLFFLLAGLALTATAGPAALDSFPRLAPEIIHSSMLPSLLVDAAAQWGAADTAGGLDSAGAVFGAAGSAAGATEAVPLHPLAIAGFLGMFTNSLAAVPFGKLDGGRATAACFGRGRAQILALLFLMILLGDASLNLDRPFLLSLWAVSALLSNLVQQGELPALEEATPPPADRSWVLFGLLMLSLACLMPVPLDISLTFGEKFASSGIEGVL